MKCLRACCVIFVLAGLLYGALAYLVLSYYPEQIKKEEIRAASLAAAFAEVDADRQQLSRRIHEIADMSEKGHWSKVQSTSKLLADESVNRLAMNYLGSDFSIARNHFLGQVQHANEVVEKQKDIYIASESDLHKKVLELEGRKKALANDFVGERGAGSPGWHLKLQEIESQLHDLRALDWKRIYDEKGLKNIYQNAKIKNEQVIFGLAVQTEMSTIVVLSQTIAARAVALRAEVEYVDVLKERRQRLAIWPLSCILDKVSPN